MAYGIFICTKCREQAQIIEVGSSKTTRCQRCNATLLTRKLRIFFSSDDLDETISVRTQIQAQIAEKGKYGHRMEGENSTTQHQVFGTEIDDKAACLIDNRKDRKKTKKPDELILGILMSHDGKMSHEELKEAAMTQDMDGERFEDVLKKLLQEGEVYSPSKGSIKIV
ncbi:hypothetical protein [Methanolobus sp. WCC4]|uniref:DUF5817 domain-containing protein n=1 Tax=Methanolobus sp. WCC4 TaxID=3125784 RepID=UPI0030FB5096